MPPHMLIQVPMPSGPAGVMLVEVSVPLVPQLLDDGKYYMDPKCLDDDTAKRRYRHRGPSLRSLVRLAVACDTAEELGKKLKRRFDRSYVRKGLTPPGRRVTSQDRAELERLLGE
jgi:hypothetical protein